MNGINVWYWWFLDFYKHLLCLDFVKRSLSTTENCQKVTNVNQVQLLLVKWQTGVTDLEIYCTKQLGTLPKSLLFKLIWYLRSRTPFYFRIQWASKRIDDFSSHMTIRYRPSASIGDWGFLWRWGMGWSLISFTTKDNWLYMWLLTQCVRRHILKLFQYVCVTQKHIKEHIFYG